MFVGVNEKKKYKTKNEKLQRFEGDLAEKLIIFSILWTSSVVNLSWRAPGKSAIIIAIRHGTSADRS